MSIVVKPEGEEHAVLYCKVLYVNLQKTCLSLRVVLM